MMKVVLLSHPAFGHLIPFYLLAKALASKDGVQAYYIATPKNIQRLRELLDLEDSSQSPSPVNFVQLPMPQLPGENPLPEGAEATTDILEEKRWLDLTRAFDLLQQPLKQFLVENKPDWLIIDVFTDWAVDVARECNIRLMSFITTSAACSVVMVSLSNAIFQRRNITGGSDGSSSTLQDLTSPPPQVTFPSTVAFRPFELMDALHKWGPENSSHPLSSISKIMKFVKGSQAVAIRTCRELEGDYLSLLSELVPGKPLIPVGFLPPAAAVVGGSHPHLANIFAWLDEQKPKSVVYVGFGSQFDMKTEEYLEVGHGLEESKLSFLWVLRNHDKAHLLPSGFLDRTASRGTVCYGWVPQWQILSHPAVGVFLSHGGWGSVIEALLLGLSLVIIPISVDQPLNARLLVDKGLATEVERNERDGSFTRKDIVKSLKQAMESMRRGRGKEISNNIRDRELNDLYVDDLVKFMRGNNIRQPRSSL